ncbi:MAG: HDIG domain-containing protein [Actinomycetota bacterium]|nr:HDIG domain-containing protein [Actinomycetota bacterium]
MVPSREEARALLARHGGDAPWTQHCDAVANAAVAVGALLRDARAVDLDALWSVALLHDIGRYATHDPILHGVEGYNLMMSLGRPDVAFVCASHVLFGIPEDEAELFGLPAQSFEPRSTEEHIVPLVDFLIEGTRPTTLSLRFASLRERNTGNTAFISRLDRAQQRATAFMAEVAEETGLSVEGVVASG